MMLADALEAVGIDRGDYIIRVNNRKVLNGVLEEMRLGNDQALKDAVMRTIDKFDKVGVDGVIELLGSGRKDQSGAFIEGVGLDNGQINACVRFLTSKDNLKNIAGFASGRSGEGMADRAGANKLITGELRKLIGRSEVGEEGVKELEEFSEYCISQGYSPDRIVVDPSVVRGLGYYTGPVFEAELTFEITDEKGRPRQFGSVAGGGRYDDLVKRFTGQAVPATGISIGVDRLLAALRMKGRAGGEARGPVVVTVMDRDRMAEYQAMAATLRQAGIRAEVYLGNPKNFGNQLKYADRRGAPVAVIQGSDEAARGVVQIKDLDLGAKLAETATLEEWKDQPAQFEAPVADLVARVRAILDRA
jgi:histidyl-tRNA synthetase